MPSVLWLTALPPDLAGGGGHLRQAHLLRAVTQRADTTLVVAGRLRDDVLRDRLAHLIELDVGLDPLPTGTLSRRAATLHQTLADSQPLEVARHGTVRSLMRLVLDRHQADVVVLECAGLAPLVPDQRHGRWSLNLHNVGSVMASQESVVGTGRRQRWLHEREARRWRSFERWVAQAFDDVVVVSDEDARAFGSPVRVTPNGVDVASYEPTPLGADPRLVFTAALYTGPNVDGIRWFVREVLPVLRRSIPAAQLDIVGSAPVAEVKALASQPGVHLHADVADVRPFLAAARAAVIPLRIGSGTRLKALEAMAAARPVVGTRIGLEGLHVTDGIDVLIADDPAAMAQSLYRVLTDDAAATALATEGRRLVETRYDWAPIAAGYADGLLAGLT